MPNFSFTPLLLSRFRSAASSHPALFRGIFLGILAVILAAMSIQYVSKIGKPGYSGQQSRSAFLRWREMILSVFHGENVYVGLNEYPNPPVMAIVLRPFAELPPAAGALTWFYAKVAMAVLAAVWIFRLVRPPPAAPLSDAARAAAVMIALPALMGDLSHNNVNIFILFLLAGVLELYRRGRDTAAGLLLALAIACKVTPLLFLAYFAWKRAWRVCGGCLAGLVLWLAIVPGATFGWSQNAQLLTDWYKLMVERPVLKGEITTEHPNQAIPGFVYRLFTHSPSFIEYLELGPHVMIPQPAAFHNLVDIGRPAAWWVVKGLTAAFVLAVVLLCRTPHDERQGWRFAAECALIVMGMLLFSERTWKHHAVTLLLPAAVLVHALTLEFPVRLKKWIAWCLVLAWLLMAIPPLLGARAGDLAMVYGTHTIAFLLITMCVCALLFKRLRDQNRLQGQNHLYCLGRTEGLNEA